MGNRGDFERRRLTGTRAHSHGDALPTRPERNRADPASMAGTLNGLRRRALELPCDTAAAIDDFQRELTALVKGLLDEDVTRFEVTYPFAWQRGGPPDEPNHALREFDCDPIADDTWRQLSDFQRYVLLTFARPGRVSSRLPSALREFCVTSQSEITA